MRLKKWQTKFAAVMLAGAMVFGQCAWAATDDVVAFAAENSTVAFGKSATALSKNSTYIVPLSLKNANNLEQESAAKESIGKYGVLKIDENGDAALNIVLRSVTVGTATDYATDYKIYQSQTKPNTGDASVNATVISTQDVYFTNGSEQKAKTVPKEISFKIPDAAKTENGIYMSMFVEAMGYAPDAYLLVDYANAVLSGDTSLNYTTEQGVSEVQQFGKYNVGVKVSVKDGQISDVVIEGSDFKGDSADENQVYFNKAAKGMKEKLVGLYRNDAEKLNGLDAVSGATASSNAIKEAAMNALGVTIEKEVIPDAPTEALKPGFYSIELKDRTDVVDHGLVGEEKKALGYIRVDASGKMYLTYQMVSGSDKEPLYVLGYNGWYKGNNISAENLTMDGVTYETESAEVPTIGQQNVVTNITVPLDGLRQTYVNNVYLYVEAMKKLDGVVSGVNFDKGKFNIDSTVTLYWDTLTALTDENEQALGFASLSDGVYKVTGNMQKPDGTVSMSDSAINHNIKLTVKDGVYYLTLDFNSLTIGSLKGYLSKLRYYDTGYKPDTQTNPTGILKDVTIDDYQTYTDGVKLTDTLGTDYPNKVTIKVIPEALYDFSYNNKNISAGTVPLQVFVPIMEAITKGTGTQPVYLKLDLSTVTATTADDAAFNETEAKQANPNASAAPDSSAAPGTSLSPTDTAKPGASQTTGTSSSPTGTAKPGTSTASTDTTKPDTSLTPTDTTKPGTTTAPTDTAKPDNSEEPDTSANPEPTNSPKPAGSTKKVKVGTKAKATGNTYKVIANGKVTLTVAKKNVKSATVPQTVKIKGVSFKVTAIAPNAFKNNKKLTTVTIGKYVTKVGNNAFKGCKKLKTVKFAKGISAKKKKSLKKQIVKAGAKKAKFK